MAIYCYSRGDDIVELNFPTGSAPKTVIHHGKRYSRDFSAESVSVPSSAWNTPIHCVASGVHPSQRGELEKFFSDHGCPTKVDSDGNPVYTSAAHRRKALKLRGFRDRSGYFG